jgi:hypothetical protein
MNAGWWSLLILPISLPLLAGTIWMIVTGIKDIRRKDSMGWLTLLIGWIGFWWSGIWTIAFIADNFTP